jgi:hypothetical protein
VNFEELEVKDTYKGAEDKTPYESSAQSLIDEA